MGRGQESAEGATRWVIFDREGSCGRDQRPGGLNSAGAIPYDGPYDDVEEAQDEAAWLNLALVDDDVFGCGCCERCLGGPSDLLPVGLFGDCRRAA